MGTMQFKIFVWEPYNLKFLYGNLTISNFCIGTVQFKNFVWELYKFTWNLLKFQPCQKHVKTLVQTVKFNLIKRLFIHCTSTKCRRISRKICLMPPTHSSYFVAMTSRRLYVDDWLLHGNPMLQTKQNEITKFRQNSFALLFMLHEWMCFVFQYIKFSPASVVFCIPDWNTGNFCGHQS